MSALTSLLDRSVSSFIQNSIDARSRIVDRLMDVNRDSSFYRNFDCNLSHVGKMDRAYKLRELPIRTFHSIHHHQSHPFFIFQFPFPPIFFLCFHRFFRSSLDQQPDWSNRFKRRPLLSLYCMINEINISSAPVRESLNPRMFLAKNSSYLFITEEMMARFPHLFQGFCVALLFCFCNGEVSPCSLYVVGKFLFGLKLLTTWSGVTIPHRWSLS